MLRHVWNLFVKSGSLWVAWIEAYVLKGRSFWVAKVPQSCSWTWRKLLNLREVARDFIHFSVGEGNKIFLWLDLWHPDGILLAKYGFRPIYDAGSQINAKLSSVIRDHHWNWPPARSDVLVSIQSQLSLVPLGDSDQAWWSISKSGKYTCNETWDHIRNKRDIVSWWRLIWFPLAIPKQAFLLWLAVKNRLVTGERMASWGFQGDVLCVFCRGCIEGRDHLFFQCSFSRRIWKFVLDRCLITFSSDDWEEIIARGVHDWKGKSLKSDLARLCLSSSVYAIWRERNSIRHGVNLLSEEKILSKICWEVRTQVLSKCKYVRSRENLLLCSLWGLPDRVLA
jgi:hypothetical protein